MISVSVTAILFLLCIGLCFIWFGGAIFAVFYEDCVTHGPGRWHTYILAPVGVGFGLTGASVIYHTVRIFML